VPTERGIWLTQFSLRDQEGDKSWVMAYPEAIPSGPAKHVPKRFRFRTSSKGPTKSNSDHTWFTAITLLPTKSQIAHESILVSLSVFFFFFLFARAHSQQKGGQDF